MKTRAVLRLGAALWLAAAWSLPSPAEATDPRIRIHHATLDESEPEVPNEVIREPGAARIDRASSRQSLPEMPATRPEDWLLRVLRLLRSLHHGGAIR